MKRFFVRKGPKDRKLIFSTCDILVLQGLNFNLSVLLMGKGYSGPLHVFNIIQ